MFALSLRLPLSPLTFLHFHGVTTGANGANTEVTGAALFAADQKTKVALQRGEKRLPRYIDRLSIICCLFFSLPPSQPPVLSL